MEKYVCVYKSYIRHNSTKDLLFFLPLNKKPLWQIVYGYIIVHCKKIEMTVFEHFDGRDLFIFL